MLRQWWVVGEPQWAHEGYDVFRDLVRTCRLKSRSNEILIEDYDYHTANDHRDATRAVYQLNARAGLRFRS